MGVKRDRPFFLPDIHYTCYNVLRDGDATEEWERVEGYVVEEHLAISSEPVVLLRDEFTWWGSMRDPARRLRCGETWTRHFNVL